MYNLPPSYELPSLWLCALWFFGCLVVLRYLDRVDERRYYKQTHKRKPGAGEKIF